MTERVNSDAIQPALYFDRRIDLIKKKTILSYLIFAAGKAVVALALGLIFLHMFAGVREGTIIGALFIGNIVKLIDRILKLEGFFDKQKA